MTLKTIAKNIALAQNDGETPILTDTQSALDLIADAYYLHNCESVIVLKQDVTEEFFDLKTKIAGEILQKFVNYNFRLAIVGDFSGYSSGSLRDFIYESNLGRVINFVTTVEEAVGRLAGYDTNSKQEKRP